MSGPQAWGAPECSAALAKEGVGQGRNLLEAELRVSGHPKVRVQEKEVSPHPWLPVCCGPSPVPDTRWSGPGVLLVPGSHRVPFCGDTRVGWTFRERKGL